VVPVVINGFWRAFTKKGLTYKKVGTPLTIRFKAPLVIDYAAPVEEILDQVMDAIEQSKSYMLKGKHHEMKVVEKL
jgi:1-acyl-sn-glycerol-3-phosphate acyltransferase